MLKEMPIAGQTVILIQSDHSETTIGCKYKIEDVDPDSGNSWFYNNNEEAVYIDDASFYCYEIVEEDVVGVSSAPPKELSAFMYILMKEARRNGFAELLEDWSFNESDYNEIEKWFFDEFTIEL